MRLLVLTAAREMEVANLAAGEVDRAARRWVALAGASSACKSPAIRAACHRRKAIQGAALRNSSL